MSYYYNYYAGQRNTKTGKVSFLGPFKKDKTSVCLFWKSRNFASDLHEDFYPVAEKDIDESIYESGVLYKDDDFVEKLKMLPLESLHSEVPFKNGYILRSEMIKFQQHKDSYEQETDAYSDVLTPEAFATFAQGYMATQKPRKVVNYYSGEEIEATPMDYVYHEWIDYNSKEYESWMIRETINNLSLSIQRDKDNEIVILETEG